MSLLLSLDLEPLDDDRAEEAEKADLFHERQWQSLLWSNLVPMFSYLDAGTGSMIITAIAGGVAGVGVAFKMGMARFRSKLTGKPVADQDSSSDDESGSAHD
jgi:hypothetical protein